METIITKTRNLIEDILKTDGRDVYTFESLSSSKIFTLTESNIDATTIIVYKNGVVWADINYNYSAITGKLTITGALAAGDSLEVIYSYYGKYSDNEIRGFIKATISHLAVEKYKTFAVKSDNIIFPTPSESEENLFALIASILVKGSVRSYRTPELTITFNESLSKEEKIKLAIRKFKKAYGVFKYVNLEEDVTIPEEDQ